jgi:bifunctional DNA-binding transcriptional regulator/antitoxin component of YhaV-PrlF toxin-antitoxin module
MTVEAAVASNGRVTLPKGLRKHLGGEDGCRIRFVIPPDGPVQLERLSYELEDLWRLADESYRPEGVMSFEEMNEAKAHEVRDGVLR